MNIFWSLAYSPVIYLMGVNKSPGRDVYRFKRVLPRDKTESGGDDIVVGVVVGAAVRLEDG